MDWRKSFRLPWNGVIFTISITQFNLVEFIKHAGLHLALSWAFGLGVSFGMALALEYKDGESGNKEGFNLFPDMLARGLGIFLWDMLTRL